MDMDGLDKPHGHGLVVGKFMPAHQGHLHLVRFACQMCRQVTVVVDCVEGQWPDSQTRADAMRQDLAGLPVRVVALDSPTPQEPDQHPGFWELWRNLLAQACGGLPDALVCAMDYGLPLSRVLGCEFIPLDLGREAVSISATQIRADPWGLWDLMLPHARTPWMARVAVEGPESTGKSTITARIAHQLGYSYMPEWAKCYIEQRARGGHEFRESDLLAIARGQVASERSFEPSASRAMLCDSSLLTTMVWGEYLYGRTDPAIPALFEREEARAPKTRWLMTPETPWVCDTHREVDPNSGSLDARWRFWDLMTARARILGLDYTVLGGGFELKQQGMLELASALKPASPPAISRAMDRGLDGGLKLI